uniref:Glycosyl hydrolase 18-like chitinase long isoform n=1 Tax=Amblyomma americanum TaxID=6943 RepID=A0A0A0QMB6_AMBAM|nr:glycosyl hydrolase 18-like chitinase long isoform [Amblyomma americanum]
MKLIALPLALLLACALGMPQQDGDATTPSTSSTSLSTSAASSVSTSQAPANATSSTTTGAASSGRSPVVCYYYGWANTRPNPANYGVDDIPGDLCTHVNFAYAGVDPQTWELKSEVPEYEGNRELFKNFTAIKTRYTQLKTLLSVGGWQHENGVFSAMAANSNRRALFIESVLRWMKEYNLDGVDMAWPFPGVSYRGGSPRDKENYASLIRELAGAFEGKGLLLTVVVPLPEEFLEAGYDIPEISKHVDWINAQAYDLRGVWNGVTDVHTPLYSRSIDIGPQKTLNVKDGLARIVSSGAPKSKVVMGIAFFGRGFTLLDPAQHGLHALVNRDVPPRPGPFVRSNEVFAYYEICLNLKGNWKREFDEEGKCPYVYYRDQWIGYDDAVSIRHKINFLLQEGYRGVYVFNNDLDDFRGFCGETNILLKTIKEGLNGNKNEITASPA